VGVGKETGEAPDHLQRVINLLAKLGRWDHAVKLLEEMKAGPQPDVVTYTSLVAAYGEGQAVVADADADAARLKAAASTASQ
jgi:pentatricopeptide repeat protein